MIRLPDVFERSQAPWRTVFAVATAAIALGILGTRPAQADITPISYLRDVMSFAVISPIEGEAIFENDSVQSTVGGIFDETLDLDLTEGDASATASILQTSNITSTGLFAAGQFSAASVQGTEADFVEALGATRVIYRFSIDQTTAGHLFGVLIAGGQGVSNAVLVGPSGVLVNHSIQQELRSIDEIFEMVPGEYELSITTGGYGQAFDGMEFPASGTFEISLATTSPASAEPVDPLAAALEPLRVVPNPIRDGAEIRFGGTVPNDATLLVTDANGRRLRTLEALESSVYWDARDDAGRRVPTGVYFVRLTGTNLVTRALVLGH